MLIVLAGGAAGLGVWSLAEYLLHRWGFHPTGAGRIGSLIAREHLIHHREPLRTSPLMRSLAWVGAVSVAAPAAMVGWIGVGFAAGWALGYTAYDQLHWRAHHRCAPNRYEAWVRARHDRHHFGHPRRNYGVTTDVWDRVFGTRVSAGQRP